MAEEKMTAEQAAQQAGKPEPKFFEFGDAFFECNRCGNYERLQKGIKDGMQFVLPTSDQHEWRLVCGKCKNMMRIFFKESDEETVKEARELLAKQEEEQRKKKEEEALEKAKKEQDESNKKGKAKRSLKRSSKNNAGSDQHNGEGETTPPDAD
jgi:hypothetical protein